MKLVELYGRFDRIGRPKPLKPGDLERLVGLARQRAGTRPRSAPAAATRARLVEKRFERTGGDHR
jgi:hypothetical protein